MKPDIRFLNILAIGVAMIMLTPSEAVAQDYISTPVSISKEKVRINGKVCYSHIVLEKQTLFSIAKAYEVSVDDIYQYNPGLRQTGLKKNAIILIPSKEALAPAVKEEPEKQSQKQESAAKEQKRRIHIRKWYEDLDVIADRYGITAEDIIKANGLKGRKLTNRQKLVIPEPGEISHETPAINEPTAAADTVMTADTSATTEPAETPSWVFHPKDKVKATLILPLKASGENISRNNMDFYSGFLLGIQHLAEKGTDIELNVYDSADSNHPIASEDLYGSDVIVGPVSYGDMGRILERVPHMGTIISPLDPRAEELAATHDNLIQAPTPLSVQYRDLVEWIEEDTAVGDTVLLITEKESKQNDAVRIITGLTDSSEVSFIPFSYSILEGRDVIEPLTALMTATGTNRVLVASESEAFVNDVVRNLNILIHNKLNVVLYAPAKIRGFETIEVENLHNAALHVSLGYHIDYDAPEVQQFLLEYRALYNTEPTQYAFQGYDIASYFLEMCSRYGTNWKRKLDVTQKKMLQSTFECSAVPDGGYVNNGVRRIVYDKDWSIRKIR